MLWKLILFSTAVLTAAVIGFVLIAGHAGISDAELQSSLPAEFIANADQGELLYHMGGCASCHVGENSDGLPTGGQRLHTKFGTFVSSNITPDLATGIGSWSAADFVNAMREGISPEGQHYYPAFPYTSYAIATNEDLLHLKKYLDSLPAVNRETEAHNILFPFNIRFGLSFWKFMVHRYEPFVPDAKKATEWNRGFYIVNGFGHCGACHTPRNILFAEISAKEFSGAQSLEIDGESAPGIAGIDQEEILNGLNEWAGAINERSSMYLITKAYSNSVPIEDHEAIAVYLSSLSPIN